MEFEDDEEAQMSIEFEGFNQHERNASLYTAIVSDIENERGRMQEFMQYISFDSYLGFYNVEE